MTIKRRIRIALSLMVILPAALMVLVFGIVSRGFERMGAIGPAAPGLGGFAPAFAEKKESEFLAEFNRLVLDDPAALADPARLAELNGLLGKDSPAGWTVLREGRSVYSSPSYTGAPGAAIGFARFHDFQDKDMPAFRWSFRFPDGSPGLLIFRLSDRRGPMDEAAHLAFLAVIALLVLCNGFLSWWAASGIVGPLARLRESALRIGEGDLDFKLESRGDDELGEVASAFETMRAKLLSSLRRQAAEETARKELVAHVSHDLRTPVAIIRGHAEGLRDGVAATPAMRDRYLAAILDRSRDLEALIELLFSYARLDLESAATRAGRLSLLPFLRDMREDLAQSFPSAEIRLEVDHDIDPKADDGALGDAFTAAADPELTRRAITNLVENAVKHGARPEVAIELRLRSLSGAVELAVSDDGEGVSDEDLPRLFEPFFRGDRARGRGGSGLGLAIVRKIMEKQGGSARAARGSAGGLEVTLSFTKAEAHGQTNSDNRG
jgi:signal transduction histidine kinase